MLYIMNQKIPKSLKKGTVLYCCYSGYDEDDGKFYVELAEWVVRSIQNRRRHQYTRETELTAFITQKSLYVTVDKKGD